VGRIIRKPFVSVLQTAASGLLAWSCPTGWVIEDVQVESLGTSTVSDPAWAIVTRGGVETQPRIPLPTVADFNPGSARFAWAAPPGSFALCPRLVFEGIGSRGLTTAVVWDNGSAPTGGDYFHFAGVLRRASECGC
jgi:hypothetical protein